MKVEIWSDVICPWCYVGKRNFDAALSGFEYRGEVDVVWRAYELDPNAPPERSGSYIERISRKYGISPDDARQRMSRIVTLGAAAGIEFRFDELRAGNTFDAHRLLHLARSLGRQQELQERLFAATFSEGHPIGERETLVKLAADVGLAEADVQGMLESRDFADDVRADEVEALELGVSGVPFFAFDRRYAVAGAQAPAVLVEVLERAWAERG